MAENPSLKKRINASEIDLFPSDKGSWLFLFKSPTERFVTNIFETQVTVMRLPAQRIVVSGEYQCWLLLGQMKLMRPRAEMFTLPSSLYARVKSTPVLSK